MHDDQSDNLPDTNMPSFEEFRQLPDRTEPYVFPIILPEVKGQLRLLKMNSVSATSSDVELSNKLAGKAELQHFNDLPLVEMNFVLDGHISQKHDYLRDELVFTRGYHNIMYNQGTWEHSRFLGAGRHHTFSIHIHTDRFIELFAGHSAQMDQMIKDIIHGKPFLIERPILSYTPQMRSIINSFWNISLTDSLKSLYMETKMIELLLLQWEQFSQPHQRISILKHKEDIDKMYLAKELLLKDLHNPPSLAQLAHLCGTNEFILKKGFKEVFNHTVFGYFNAMRLEQAKELILHTHKTITEIASETGYANPQHFTRAFKKKFGITPGGLKK